MSVINGKNRFTHEVFWKITDGLNISNAKYWNAQMLYEHSIWRTGFIYGVILGFLLFVFFIIFGYLDFNTLYTLTPTFMRFIYG